MGTLYKLNIFNATTIVISIYNNMISLYDMQFIVLIMCNQNMLQGLQIVLYCFQFVKWLGEVQNTLRLFTWAS